MKKRNISFFNIGFPSILMVFLTICLVTFAALSLLTAASDYKLSQKSADKTTAYYAADKTARDAANIIDDTLFLLYEQSENEDAYYNAINTALFSSDLSDQIADFTVTNTNHRAEASYHVQISDVQTLYVVLELVYPTGEYDCFHTVAKWQSVTDNPPSDTTLHLYGSD